MTASRCPVIADANQKGGVGKTTTTVNLAQALALQNFRVLVVNLDPQANATQALGIPLEDIRNSVGDLIRDRNLDTLSAVYRGSGIDLIPSTPLLAKVEREMVGTTNSELRLAQRLTHLQTKYGAILIDSPPKFGPLLNTALNAASKLLIPVDSGFFALTGIKNLLAEVNVIRLGTNPGLEVLGYLLTLTDQTRMAEETWDGLVSAFGDQVLECRIRRSVRLREAPALGKTIFHHDPGGAGTQDYLALSKIVIKRLGEVSRG